MALNASPRKVVPLSAGDDWDPSASRSAGPSLTRRVFFCGVVLEGYGSYPEDVRDLVQSLGDVMSVETEGILDSRSHAARRERSDSISLPARITTRKRALTNTSALQDVIAELVSTERSYVKRLQNLKRDYADPLRTFARSRDTMIISSYNAKTLFGNIDQLLPVNEAFLEDLVAMVEGQSKDSLGIGDVALKHFRDLRGFENYKQYYAKREEAQAIFEAEYKKRNSGFSTFVDNTRYSLGDYRNRVGLRELLMEPVQRIPRYTLLFRTMIKHMAPDDPQRAMLVEADKIASEIALAETDEQTRRAAIMHCLSATIEGFPVTLFSSSRKFIDFIDVEDTVSLTHSHERRDDGGSGSKDSLHCTLFLFDDKLIIVKRPDGEKGGARALASFDELEKVTKVGGLPNGKKKSGMVCKRVVDVTDVVATDVGGSDMHVFLEKHAQERHDRWWGGRPYRPLTVVDPPNPPNLNPAHTEAAKKRFLENLWAVQARFRLKQGQSVAMQGEEIVVEVKGEKVTKARTYYNVYTRTAFLQEAKKTKVVLHVDAQATADPIPFGLGGGAPLVVIRVQPMAGELCRYTVASSDLHDEGEEDIVQSGRVSHRVVQTIHQYGLFRFSTGSNSVPSTPTATRSRAAIFGLDAISRNLFNVRPGSKTTDLFAGNAVNHRRNKSSTVLSRSSTVTATASTTDSSMLTSRRSNSTTTAATSMSSGDDDTYTPAKRRSRKLMKRGKSPSSDYDSAFSRSLSRSRSRSRSAERQDEGEVKYSDPEDEDGSPVRQAVMNKDHSERVLTMRLELARQNSRNQTAAQSEAAPDDPVEESIYEQEPPQPFRPLARASREVQSTRSATPTPRPESPTPVHSPQSPSIMTPERRPVGPRSSSPYDQSPASSTVDLPESDDLRSILEATLVNTPLALTTPVQSNSRTSPLPRSKRMPLIPMSNLDNTPTSTALVEAAKKSSTEPLSIKKKTSVRSGASTTFSPPRKSRLGASPLSESTTAMAASLRSKPPPQGRVIRQGTRYKEAEHLSQLAKTTKEDLESSNRAVKKMRVEVDKLRSKLTSEGASRKPEFDQYSNISREAMDRLIEMHAVIAKRKLEGSMVGPVGAVGRSRSRSLIDAAAPSQREQATSSSDIARSLEMLVSDLEKHIMGAIASQEEFCEQFSKMRLNIENDATELEQVRVQRQSAKMQNDALMALYDYTVKEKDIMYDTYNEELALLSTSLPSHTMEALYQVTEARKKLDRENKELRCEYARVKAERDEWRNILRSHGLIS